MYWLEHNLNIYNKNVKLKDCKHICFGDIVKLRVKYQGFLEMFSWGQQKIIDVLPF